MAHDNKIAECREKIDEIDEQLLQLLNERAKCSLEIRKIKKELGADILDAQREQQVVERLKQKNSGPLRDTDIEELFFRIMKTMREIPNE